LQIPPSKQLGNCLAIVELRVPTTLPLPLTLAPGLTLPLGLTLALPLALTLPLPLTLPLGVALEISIPPQAFFVVPHEGTQLGQRHSSLIERALGLFADALDHLFGVIL